MKHPTCIAFLIILMLVGTTLVPACQDTPLTSPSSPLAPPGVSASPTTVPALSPPTVTTSAPPTAVTSTHTLLPVVQNSITPTPSLFPPLYTYRIVQAYPHDRRAFTQGLIYHDGQLYEGTGLRGRSSLRRVHLETGDVLQIHHLPDQYFGEGITLYDGDLIQLTWQSEVGFVYDQDFGLLQTFQYDTEGWGITHDGQRLIMSDGSATLYFWDPQTFQEIGRVQVRDQGTPVKRLNELEYVQGLVYANVWLTDRIAQIDPETGRVVGWIDLTGLLKPEDQAQPVDVLNGIAYDAEGDRLFVTGKLWPLLFEIELIPAQ